MDVKSIGRFEISSKHLPLINYPSLEPWLVVTFIPKKHTFNRTHLFHTSANYLRSSFAGSSNWRISFFNWICASLPKSLIHNTCCWAYSMNFSSNFLLHRKLHFYYSLFSPGYFYYSWGHFYYSPLSCTYEARTRYEVSDTIHIRYDDTSIIGKCKIWYV